MFRILKYVHRVQQYGRVIVVPAEFGLFLDSISTALDEYQVADKSSETAQTAADYAYWDATNTAREVYRASVVATFTGETRSLSPGDFQVVLNKMEAKVQEGIDRALATNGGLSPTYFYYECTEYDILKPEPTAPGATAPPTKVVGRHFNMHTLPLFLEGPTRHFKVAKNIEAKRDIYQRVKKSALYDAKLQMYTLSASLAGMSQDIGRMMVGGWVSILTCLMMTFELMFSNRHSVLAGWKISLCGSTCRTNFISRYTDDGIFFVHYRPLSPSK
jgi:hypothetical protein